MPNHDPERALVQGLLDLADHRLDRATAEMAAELDLYRDDFSTRYTDQLRHHNERVAAIRAETDQYIKSLYGEADEPAPTQDVGQGRGASSAPGPAPAPGRGPGQPPNPHAVELEEAERLHDLTMAEYAAERQRLIRPTNQGMF